MIDALVGRRVDIENSTGGSRDPLEFIACRYRNGSGKRVLHLTPLCVTLSIVVDQELRQRLETLEALRQDPLDQAADRQAGPEKDTDVCGLQDTNKGVSDTQQEDGPGERREDQLDAR